VARLPAEIGNSLPPLLARAVGSEIVTAMELHPEKPTKILPLGDVSLLRLATRDAADHFGVDIEAVPSHKLRHRKKKGGAGAEEQAAEERAA
jgi:DNA (cytosine-5)-methyltransferase 1